MKKIINVLLVLVVLMGSNVHAETRQVDLKETVKTFVNTMQEKMSVSVEVDGKRIEFPDAKPYINSDNRTLVPVRFIAENLGVAVEWDEKKQEVYMKGRGKEISLVIGQSRASVNGKEITFDTKASLKENRTFVPLRFISESFGANVDWNLSEKMVKITTKNNTEVVQKETVNDIKEGTKIDMNVVRTEFPIAIGDTEVLAVSKKGKSVYVKQTTAKSLFLYFDKSHFAGPVLNVDTNSKFTKNSDGSFTSEYYIPEAVNISNVNELGFRTFSSDTMFFIENPFSK